MKVKTKILLVFGTRPEAVKMAPLFYEFKKYKKEFHISVCVTAQHRDLLDQVLRVFNIVPDFDLNLMKKGQDLFDITSSVLLGMKDIFDVIEPDWVLVHGDTTTSSVVSMASFYKGIPVAHIEAGLRTHNMRSPFPEEFNRRFTSIVANLHFAPTEIAKSNLLAEGINDSTIVVTGNTVIDAMKWVLARIEVDVVRKNSVEMLIKQSLNFNWKFERFILITGHRRESFGGGFDEIALALRDLAIHFPDVYFVYPVHPNPNVQKPINDILTQVSNIFLIRPLEYEPFLYLLKHCYFVLTDSGGIQEEAPSFSKPVLLMRDTTERPEGVTAGTVLLVGANREKIFSSVSELLSNPLLFQSMSCLHHPYGDGNASAMIVNTLRNLKK